MTFAYLNAKCIEDDAWVVVQRLREGGEENTWIWSVSQDVDEAWVRYTTANAAKTCADESNDDVLFTTIPDAAAWANARTDVLRTGKHLEPDQFREAVLERWQRIREEEESRQAATLRGLVETVIDAI